MHYAIVEAARREAFPGGSGQCPLCKGDVVARCGDINAWHWAHRSRSDCDTFAEGEGAWHLAWKKRFFKRWREVVIGSHRADIRSPQGVIELQSSSISLDNVVERESFYGEMVWVVDARDFNLVLRDRGSHVTFRWKHPRKTWWYAGKPLFFDLGDRLFKIHRIYENIPCGGSGTFLSYEQFVAAYSRPKPGQSLCEVCQMPFDKRILFETGLYEYNTLDVDPGTLICCDCHERRCDDRTPDDPELFDCLTPLSRVW